MKSRFNALIVFITVFGMTFGVSMQADFAAAAEPSVTIDAPAQGALRSGPSTDRLYSSVLADAPAALAHTDPLAAALLRTHSDRQAPSLAPSVADPTGYHSAWVDQSPHPVLPPNSLTQVTVLFLNSGTEPWRKGVAGQQANLGIVGDSREFSDAGLNQDWPTSDRVATQAEDLVVPGALATFTFSVRAPGIAGSYVLPLRPVIDGTTWMEDEGVFLTVVSSADFHSRWFTQSPHVVLTPGEASGELFVQFMNTADMTWSRDVSGQQANLGVIGDDRSWYSPELGWPTPDRVAVQSAMHVRTGEIATFRFRVRAPETSGVHYLQLRPVIDGTTWMEDDGVWFQITVSPAAGQAETSAALGVTPPDLAAASAPAVALVASLPAAATQAPTPVPTATVNSTPAPTPTGTATPAPTATPTAIATPTATPTPAPTAAPTIAPTGTPTVAPTATPTPTPTATPPTPPAPGGLALRVSGNRIVNAAGQPVQLHGVNYSGTEYACIQGWGIFDGPNDQAMVSAMKSWNVNFVRLPLNETCWLGINGVAPQYAGQNYINAITSFVALLQQNGIYVELSLMWAAPGTYKGTYQPAAPNADHSPAMWTSLAATFANNPAVILAPWGEPTVNADCFLAGGCTATFNNVAYATAGMQQAVTLMRNAGYRGIIAIPGLDYANDMTSWLSHKPSDPQGQLIAEAHIYGNNVCGAQNNGECLTRTIGPVANAVPVIFGETGETYDDSSCTGNNARIILPWADAHNVGYATWTWNTWGTCGSLISAFNGTVRGSGYAIYVRDHLLTR